MKTRSQLSGSMCLLLAAALFALPASAIAQSRQTEHTLELDDPDQRPAATIEQMAWLAGQWAGDGLGGRVEEFWGSPSGRTMAGIFKLVHGDVTTLYEIEAIVENEGSLEVRLRHVNGDFTSWERRDEFVTFPLVRLDADGAWFSGLTFRRVGADELRVCVALEQAGEVVEAEMSLRRVVPR